MLPFLQLWKGYASRPMTQRPQNHTQTARFGKDMLQDEEILWVKSHCETTPYHRQVHSNLVREILPRTQAWHRTCA